MNNWEESQDCTKQNYSIVKDMKPCAMMRAATLQTGDVAEIVNQGPRYKHCIFVLPRPRLTPRKSIVLRALLIAATLMADSS